MRAQEHAEPNEIPEVELIDANGDEERFATNLPHFSNALNADAPGTLSDRLTAIWAWLKCYTPKLWTAGTKTIEWGIQRFTDLEAKRIRAEAEAYRTRRLADAEAELKLAQADLIRAEATVKVAQGVAAVEQQAVDAKEAFAHMQRKDELYQKLLARGMDWKAELDVDGQLLRVVVTKNPSRDGRARPRSK